MMIFSRQTRNIDISKKNRNVIANAHLSMVVSLSPMPYKLQVRGGFTKSANTFEIGCEPDGGRGDRLQIPRDRGHAIAQKRSTCRSDFFDVEQISSM